jgi:hypothetical protein
MTYDQTHIKGQFCSTFLLPTNDLEKVFGNRVGIFTIQCKMMHPKPKNMGAYLLWGACVNHPLVGD